MFQNHVHTFFSCRQPSHLSSSKCTFRHRLYVHQQLEFWMGQFSRMCTEYAIHPQRRIVESYNKLFRPEATSQSGKKQQQRIGHEKIPRGSIKKQFYSLARVMQLLLYSPMDMQLHFAHFTIMSSLVELQLSNSMISDEHWASSSPLSLLLWYARSAALCSFILLIVIGRLRTTLYCYAILSTSLWIVPEQILLCWNENVSRVWRRWWCTLTHIRYSTCLAGGQVRKA